MVLILVLAVFGVLGYMQMGVDRYPKVDLPIITVTTRLPGAAPADVEMEITDKIEEAVNTVSGIDELHSVSAEGISIVYITFFLEKDIDVASQDVRDKINRVLPDLPEDIEQPTVEKMDPDATPVLSISVSGNDTLKALTEYSDKVLRRQLESIKDVGQVMIVGGQARQVNVVLDPMKVRAHGLTVVDVARALAAQNLQIPGGTVKSGANESTLRTLGRVESVEAIHDIAVVNRGGHTVTVGELGRVEDGTEETESVSFYNETPAIQLDIRKQSGTNTVEVVRRLHERLEQIVKTAPKNYHIEIVRDEAAFIEASADTVKEHLVLGGILAAVVVFFFLANWRTTVIAALAIPTSIVSAFSLMYYMGFTLNSITLLALTLSVGIVIDDAIVVLENIYRYIDEKDYSPREAALAATKEIGLAVLAITFSLIAVFLPIAFMGGIVGKFLQSFGVTMSVTILVSMIVSFSLTPMLASRWLRKKAGRPALPPGAAEAAPIDVAVNGPSAGPVHAAGSTKSRGFYRVIESVYLVLLRFSLRHRWLVVLFCAAALGAIYYVGRLVPSNFMPDDDRSEFEISMRAPEGTSLEATQTLVTRLARRVRGVEGVRYTLASVGSDEQRTPNLGKIYVRLVDVAERKYNQTDMMDFIRQKILPDYGGQGLRISVTPLPMFSGGGLSQSDIQFLIGGRDMDKLEEYARRLMQDLRGFPGVVDIDSSLVPGKPELGVAPDRDKAGDLGVLVADVAKSLRLLVNGDKVSDYNENGEQYEIHVRAGAEFRNNLDELLMVSVPSTKLGSVALRDVVRFTDGTGPAQINRFNRKRQVTITANVQRGVSQQAVLDFLQASTDKLRMGPDYSRTLVGTSKEMARMQHGFAVVFITAFIFVYLVIAAQFESWLHPITILLCLPLTVPFALVSLLIFQQSINILSLLGILVLFAVVKKNSILQIDHTNQLREAGMPRDEAIVAANLDRLRPILMTTVAFVAGMIPLLVSNGAGAATNKAISGVVIGGQTLSLLLTLLATPVAYSIFDDVAHLRLFRWWRSAAPQKASLQPESPPLAS